jgi:hypothetical protein
MSFEEKLVEAVRENRILFDLKHPNYRRVDIKDRLWREIAHNLKSTGECNIKLNNIKHLSKQFFYSIQIF